MMPVRIAARALVLCGAGFILTACKGKEGPPARETATASGALAPPAESIPPTAARPESTARPAAADTSTKGCCGGGMAGMPGMHGKSGMHGMMTSAMMDSMQTHMKKMSASMSADQMAAMVPMHRQMVGAMLSQMTSEARTMNVPANAAWTALSDSVRQDLARLPEMNKNEVKQAMPEQCARVGRLMQTYKKMMAGTSK